MVVTYKTPRKDLDLSPQDQLPAESPKPAAWPKVFERLAWADGVVKARLYRNATAAVFHRITTRAGTPEGCTESVPNMALGLGLCRRAVQGAIKAIRADGYMNVLEQSGNTYICVPMMGKTVETLEGGRRCCTPRGADVAPQGGADVAPKRTSSSKESKKKEVPGVVDASKVDDSEPETGVTTGVEFFSLEEEGVTGTGPKDYQAFQDFVDGQLSEVPTDSEIEPLAKHCWPEWAKHWGGGWAAAWPTWTKDPAGRKKFRTDVVAQLAKVGLPKPMAPDPDNDRARERSAAWLDQRLAEAPKRVVKCAGCGFPRQLKPGETHCSPCRKPSEAPRIASLPGPAIWKTDEYEKLLGETIRRYHQEAHGPAPEDAKVEAVGAALDAG